MNGQYFGDRFNSSDFVEKTNKDTNSPVVNSDPYADKAPLDAAVIHEAPVDETIVHDDLSPYKTPVSEPVADVSEVIKSTPYNAPLGETITPQAPVSVQPVLPTTLLNREETELFRTRWNEIQGKFVDEPRSAVQEADGLVTEVIEQITQMFAKEHGMLESQWKQGNDVSTEDLRKALQRYRSFFNRLVV